MFRDHLAEIVCPTVCCSYLTGLGLLTVGLTASNSYLLWVGVSLLLLPWPCCLCVLAVESCRPENRGYMPLALPVMNSMNPWFPANYQFVGNSEELPLVYPQPPPPATQVV